MKILYKTREKAYKTNETSMNQHPTVYTRMNKKNRGDKKSNTNTKKKKGGEKNEAMRVKNLVHM
jgi:hypothetical protein